MPDTSMPDTSMPDTSMVIPDHLCGIDAPMANLTREEDMGPMLTPVAPSVADAEEWTDEDQIAFQCAAAVFIEGDTGLVGPSVPLVGDRGADGWTASQLEEFCRAAMDHNHWMIRQMMLSVRQLGDTYHAIKSTPYVSSALLEHTHRQWYTAYHHVINHQDMMNRHHEYMEHSCAVMRHQESVHQESVHQASS